MIEIKNVKDLDWVANINDVEVGQAKYYIDLNGDYWLKDISVYSDYWEKDFATELILAAVKKYGQVYFSDTERWDFNTKYPKHGYDSRYLTEDGRAFVEKLIHHKLIPADWLREQIP